MSLAGPQHRVNWMATRARDHDESKTHCGREPCHCLCGIPTIVVALNQFLLVHILCPWYRGGIGNTLRTQSIWTSSCPEQYMWWLHEFDSWWLVSLMNTIVINVTYFLHQFSAVPVIGIIFRRWQQVFGPAYRDQARRNRRATLLPRLKEVWRRSVQVQAVNQQGTLQALKRTK